MSLRQEALNLFRMGLFGAAHGWQGVASLLSKICHTYPTLMKLGTVMPYLKKIQKIHKSRDTTFSVLPTSSFFLWKSAIFVISGNTGIDYILMHNF